MTINLPTIDGTILQTIKKIKSKQEQQMILWDPYTMRIFVHPNLYVKLRQLYERERLHPAIRSPLEDAMLYGYPLVVTGNIMNINIAENEMYFVVCSSPKWNLQSSFKVLSKIELNIGKGTKKKTLKEVL